MAPIHSPAGNAQRRFYLVTTLLSMIDEVRGEPTTHGLDKHPHDSAKKKDGQLKKFLDSFAWICSTSKNGATTSAVGIEQNGPTGTILRLARNLGVPDDVVERLQNLLDELSAVATGESTRREKEPVILRQIVDLDHEGIRSLLKKLSDPGIREQVRSVMEKRDGLSAAGDNDVGDDDDESTDADFEAWSQDLLPLTYWDPTPSKETLLKHIRWASQARWKYSEQLESLFCPDSQDTPSWFNHIYKLGRYFVAAKCMLHAAAKLPSVFASIHIQAIEAPEQQRFTLYNDRNALSDVLKKLTNLDQEDLMVQLGKLWFSDDPEKRFRTGCRHDLTVHAEMQVLTFYDHHPELEPSLKFMGTSKKACYLCQEFLSRHSMGMTVSATHQKIYPSWMQPPCTSPAVRKKYKVLLWELSRHLEQTTAKDLETRLGIKRARSLDSTAGPSIPTTESQAFHHDLRPPVTRNPPASTVAGDDGLGNDAGGDGLEEDDSSQGESVPSPPFANPETRVYWIWPDQTIAGKVANDLL